MPMHPVFFATQFLHHWGSRSLMLILQPDSCFKKCQCWERIGGKQPAALALAVNHQLHAEPAFEGLFRVGPVLLHPAADDACRRSCERYERRTVGWASVHVARVLGVPHAAQPDGILLSCPVLCVQMPTRSDRMRSTDPHSFF